MAGLSLIGNMMRGNAKETIIASSHRTINKIKSLLDNLHCESDINPKDAHFWEDKGIFL